MCNPTNVPTLISQKSWLAIHPTIHIPTLRLGQLLQRIALHPQPHPLCLLLRANHFTLIKLQTRLIPIQTTPLQPLPTHLPHLLRQRLQKRLAIPFLPIIRLDEQVFEVYARHARPGAVVVEVQRHARNGAVGVGEE